MCGKQLTTLLSLCLHRMASGLVDLACTGLYNAFVAGDWTIIDCRQEVDTDTSPPRLHNALCWSPSQKSEDFMVALQDCPADQQDKVFIYCENEVAHARAVAQFCLDELLMVKTAYVLSEPFSNFVASEWYQKRVKLICFRISLSE